MASLSAVPETSLYPTVDPPDEAEPRTPPTALLPSPDVRGAADEARARADEAHVWGPYHDKMVAHDRDTLLAGWHKSLDAMLLFAGLLSVVAATFLVSEYSTLQPQATNVDATLRALVLAINNCAPANVTVPDVAPQGSPSLTRTINAVWFTSLILSLSVAFLALLARQWLDGYSQRVLATRVPSARWASAQRFFAAGLVTWHVDTFITQLLPTMLHASLSLLMIGLAILTWILDRTIAFLLVAILALLAIFYTACAILPIVYPASPTYTQLTRAIINALLNTCRIWPWLVPASYNARIQSRLLRLRAREPEGEGLSASPVDHRLVREVLLRSILSGSDDACRAAFRILDAPSDMTRPAITSSSPSTDVEVISMMRMNLLFRHPSLGLGPFVDPFPHLPVDLLSDSTSTVARLLTMMSMEENTIDESEVFVMFAKSDEPFLSSTALLLFRNDGVFPPGKLFLLLALVSFETLNSNDSRLVVDKCFSVTRFGDESREPSQPPDAISIVSPITFIMGKSHALSSGRLAVAHIIASSHDDLTKAEVSPYAVALSRFIVSRLRSDTPSFPPYLPTYPRHDVLNLVPAFTEARLAINRIDMGTGAVADGLLRLIDQAVDAQSDDRVEVETWRLALCALINCFNSRIIAPAATGQDELRMATVLAAGLLLLRRMQVDEVPSMTTDFRGAVRAFLTGTTAASFGERGVQFARQYLKIAPESKDDLKLLRGYTEDDAEPLRRKLEGLADTGGSADPDGGQ